MINVISDGEGLYVNEISYESYEDLKCDLFMILLEVITLYGIDNPNREDDKVLTFIMDIQDLLTNFENSIKTKNNELYEEYLNNRNGILKDRRNIEDE